MSDRLQGTGAAPGLGMGQAYPWPPPGSVPLPPPAADVSGPASLDRFLAAAARVQTELAVLAADVAARAGPDAAAILSAQALMAQDPELVTAVAAHLEQGVDLIQAVRRAAADLAADLAALPGERFGQRAVDVRDVAARIIAKLAGVMVPPLIPYPDTVLIAAELPPSIVAGLDPARVRAIVTEAGGATAHAAILAQGLGIPAVMGCAGIRALVRPGDLVAVDGTAGAVVVRPDAPAAAVWRQRLRAAATPVVDEQVGPAVTRDGQRLLLMANVAGAAGAEAALAAGAEGVGLFRTEFLFLDRPDLPDEEEQFREYRSLVAAMAPRPVVIRTLDIGGDKALPALPLPAEANPYLGWRGLRLWLERPEVAVPQVRALLRAARYGDLRILLPMVTDVAEVHRARAFLEDMRRSLAGAAGPVGLGIMVEVPAAALMADRLAAAVDFFSIGTNDLTQYTLAADRGNPKVASLYDPLHPAVLRLIDVTVKAAHRRGVPVAVCGSAAGEEQAIPVLAALGVDELSMPAPLIPAARRQIRGLDAADRRRARRRLRPADPQRF